MFHFSRTKSKIVKLTELSPLCYTPKKIVYPTQRSSYKLVFVSYFIVRIILKMTLISIGYEQLAITFCNTLAQYD